MVYAEDDITESEVLDDAETEENWKRLCEKLDVPASVNLTDYVNVDCDVIVQKKPLMMKFWQTLCVMEIHVMMRWKRKMCLKVIDRV